MNIQMIIVLSCIIIAVAFMTRKIYRTLKRGICADCDKSCKKTAAECAGGADCPHQKKLVELKPR